MRPMEGTEVVAPMMAKCPWLCPEEVAGGKGPPVPYDHLPTSGPCSGVLELALDLCQWRWLCLLIQFGLHQAWFLCLLQRMNVS